MKKKYIEELDVTAEYPDFDLFKTPQTTIAIVEISDYDDFILRRFDNGQSEFYLIYNCDNPIVPYAQYTKVEPIVDTRSIIAADITFREDDFRDLGSLIVNKMTAKAYQEYRNGVCPLCGNRLKIVRREYRSPFYNTVRAWSKRAECPHCQVKYPEVQGVN